MANFIMKKCATDTVIVFHLDALGKCRFDHSE